MQDLATTPPALPASIERQLEDLYVRGTPENTLRAYERDLIYITAWKEAAFGQGLAWPEPQEVAIRFVLDHARALETEPPSEPAKAAAETLIEAGLRKSLACPAPSTLDRRIASWAVFHRMRNLESPFSAPLLIQTRRKARRAAARKPVKKSQNPITREVLEELIATCDGTLRGIRDRAILLTGFASGGRRRSELTDLNREDISLKRFNKDGILTLTLLETKTTSANDPQKLILKGLAARGLVAWIDSARIENGPLFRPVSKGDNALKRRLSPDAIRQIVKYRLKLAGYKEDFASPHGLRSGFLTEAALQGAPIQAAMKLSLHRSMAQAQKYYDDVEIENNPATDLLGD